MRLEGPTLFIKRLSFPLEQLAVVLLGVFLNEEVIDREMGVTMHALMLVLFRKVQISRGRMEIWTSLLYGVHGFLCGHSLGVFGEVGEVLWHSAYSMVDQAKTSRVTTVVTSMQALDLRL